jgi:hypothetical protein
MGDHSAPSDAADGAALAPDGGDAPFEGGQPSIEGAADVGAPADATDGGGASTDAGGDAADGQSASPDGASSCDAICAPPVSFGWSGPYALYEAAGSPPPPLPSCDAGAFGNHIDDGFEGLDAGPAQCSCACGPVTGASCGPPLISFFSDQRCTQSCSPASQTVATTCTRLNIDTCGGVHFTLEGGAASGTCVPEASTTLAPPVLGGNARICGLPSSPTTSGCVGGTLCVPSPLEGALCVAQAGTWACPAGYPALHMYYTSYSDTRSCTSCTCGLPTGIACSATLSTFGDTNCTGGFGSSSAPAQCSGAGVRSAMTTATTATGGNCAPSGGQSAGGVTPTAGRTVCCTE